MATLEELAAECDRIENSGNLINRHDEYAAAHKAYYDALGAALGYDRHDESGYFVDSEGRAPNVAMMESALAAHSTAER